MGEHSQKAFTADKLKKFGVSGAGTDGPPNRDKAAKADDYGRKAAHAGDSDAPMAFADGGAARKPSLGRVGRANGGRLNRPAIATANLKAANEGGNVTGKIPDVEGGKPRNISILSDGGPRSYGERPLIIGKGKKGDETGDALRARGGRVGRAEGGKAYGPQQDPDWRDWHDDPQGHTTLKGGRLTPFEKFSIGMWDKSSIDPRNWGSDSPDPNEPNPQPPRDDPERARGGRVGLKRGGKAKGKTVVNVIVGGHDKDQPPAPPPMAAPGPVVPPMPPPRPPMPPAAGPPGAGGGGPPMGPPPAAPMGPAGAPPGGIPPQLLGRAHGGRIKEKFGAGSGPGRIEKSRRENSGKVKLGK